MARQTPRRRAWTAAGLVVGLVALSAGAWALHRWKPFADDPVAVSWPDNVRPLAEYVEQATGLQFLQPVRIEFVADDDAFEARANPPVEHTDQERASAAADEAMGRSLGFWDERLKILDGAATLRGANAHGIAWEDATGTIVVHAKGEATTLSVTDRAALVLQLTESIDDQHYDISDRLADIDGAQPFQALAALDVGQAIWVRDRYVAHLSTDDAADYEDAQQSGGKVYASSVDDLSLAFRSVRVAAQVVAVPFVKALHESSRRDAIAVAFADDPPTAIDQLSMPVSKYERRDTTEAVEPPPVPVGGSLIQTRNLGPFGLYMVMAGGLSVTEALAAADGWGNDAVTVYRMDDRTCLDARIVADSRSDADRIELGLHAWGAGRPVESSVLVGRDGTTLLLSACDPGDADQPIVDRVEIDQWFTRADVMGDQMDYVGLPDVAECSTVRFFEQHTASDWQGQNADFDPFDELDSLTSECAKAR